MKEEGFVIMDENRAPSLLKAYAFRLKMTLTRICLAKSREEAKPHWNKIAQLKKLAKRDLGIDLFDDSPGSLIIRLKDKAPDVYSACERWGFVK